MKRKHFVLLFLFLSSISFVWFVANGKSDSDDLGDKIKKAVDNGIKNVSDKAKESGAVAVEKIKESGKSLYQSTQEKGSELLESYVLSPAKSVIDKCIEKAVSAGISVLPQEQVKSILESAGSSCSCPQ